MSPLFCLQMPSATYGLETFDQAVGKITPQLERITNDLAKSFVNAHVKTTIYLDRLLREYEKHSKHARFSASVKLDV